MSKVHNEKIKEVETLVAIEQAKMDQLLTLQRDAASSVHQFRMNIEDFMEQLKYSPIDSKTQQIVLCALNFALGSSTAVLEQARLEEMKNCLEQMKALNPSAE